MRYKELKKFLLEKTNILEKYEYQGYTVIINKNYDIFINEDKVVENCSNLYECKKYIKNYISKISIIQDSYIPEQKLVGLIKKHHNIDRITNTLVETYIELINAKRFTTDPIIKYFNNSSIANKIEFILDDGNTVSINETTLEKLREHIGNKYKIIDYMQESKDNFFKVIKEIRD